MTEYQYYLFSFPLYKVLYKKKQVHGKLLSVSHTVETLFIWGADYSQCIKARQQEIMSKSCQEAKQVGEL